MTKMTQTIETRLPRDVSDKFDSVLKEYAAHYSKALRVLVSRKNKGIAVNKSDFLKEFGLTGRQFNAIKREVDGLFDSQKSNYQRYILEAHRKNEIRSKRLAELPLAFAKAHEIADPEQRKQALFKLRNEQKGCHDRITKTSHKIERWLRLLDDGQISVCFGSRKLFNAQYNLEANGFCDHATWREAFVAQRDSEFFTLGSKDEVNGNQTCTITRSGGDLFNIRLRLPNAMVSGKNTHIELNHIPFNYRTKKLLKAIESNDIRSELKKGWKGNKGLIERHQRNLETKQQHSESVLAAMVKRGDKPKDIDNARLSYDKSLEKFSKFTESNALCDFGQALSCRFKRDHKGWRVILSIDTEIDVEPITERKNGAIGIDLNEHHLAVAEIDSRGNKTQTFDLYFRDKSYGDGSNQVKTGLGEAIAKVTRLAQETGKPIVIENLDFKAKKSELKSGREKQYNKMVSSLVTAKFLSIIKLRCAEKGIELIPINAAYTSFIGKLKYNNEVNFNVHQAAAIVIARRGIGFSNRKLPKLPMCLVRSEQMPFPVPKDSGNGDAFAYIKRVHKAFGKWFEQMLSVSAPSKRALVQPDYCAEIPF
ncbi:IS200/IS605 family accessory protein TnpB-related protein [Vibrio sp. D431a]|uniref:IS200/IS605 family accessory protein TnpB-related protein n=1 Tax=Vibrio sp. D431a TaxID=2837388 RepID=UPI002552D405|nr:IS200/IS605 family accessory protein TnpB-related protein [Vibrio sp. D431a]MDK9789818.1 IS200/IS605 family accessory protein TnpB-related protein [Vibrio sp. D431a]